MYTRNHILTIYTIIDDKLGDCVSYISLGTTEQRDFDTL